MKDSLKIILLIQIIMLVSIVLDIPIVRQFFGFIYVSFIPGFLVLKNLYIDMKDKKDVLLLSMGLSISFNMFVGLFMNEIYPFLGIIQPLSTIPITSTFIFLTITLTYLYYKKDLFFSNDLFLDTNNYSFNKIIILLIPFLSIIGSLYLNTRILIFGILLITLYYVIILFSNKYVSSHLYPLIIFSISIFLLFQLSFISTYLLGYDVNLESYVFKNTLINGRWNSPISQTHLQSNNFNSMLSITIFPTIYALLLKINKEALFMIIYCAFYAVMPLILYQIYSKQIDRRYAFLSVLVYMSNQNAFYGVQTFSHNRQNIAEIFLMITILLLITKEIPIIKKKILLMIFSASIIVSHYSISYLYLLYTFLILIFSAKKEYKSIINKTLFLYFISITIIWNIFVSDSLIISIISVFRKIYKGFYIDIFKLEARSIRLSQLVMPAPTLLNLVHRILYLLIYLFILIGIIKIIIHPHDTKFHPIYRLISLVSISIVLLSILFPNLAPSLNLERILSINLLVLSPMFVLGGKTIFDLIDEKIIFTDKKHKIMYENKKWDVKLISFIIIIFFLFQIGFLNHIFSDKPISFSLDFNRMKTINYPEVKIYFYDAFIPEQDVYSAKWISAHARKNSLIYADRGSKLHVLTSYGLFDQEQLIYLSQERAKILWNNSYIYLRYMQQWNNSYIYLRRLNVVDDIMKTWGEPYYIEKISHLLYQNNKIYSNGDSEIYRAYKKYN